MILLINEINRQHNQCLTFRAACFFKDKTLGKPLNIDNVMAELDQKSPIKEHGLGA